MTARPPASARVGALFQHDTAGGHFCTASVVDSPRLDLLVTAAHCVYDGGPGGAGVRDDLVFVPGCVGGTSGPEGVWRVRSVAVDPRWSDGADLDLDVAFVALQSLAGRQIGDVLGADRLGVDRPRRLAVRVTGYPSDRDAPVTCATRTQPLGATQLRFDCPGFADGTSGSPWVTDVDPVTGTGTVVGVIGGYQTGGSTPDTSCSAYFGDDVETLYQRAVAQDGTC